MAKFEEAFPYVLANEVGPYMHTGGYTNDPVDPGGETKWGISKRTFPQEDIKNLTVERAAQLYKIHYWHFDGVINQRIATKVFDHYFNRPASIKQVQEALHITADGIYGGNTEHALNQAFKNPDDFLAVFVLRLEALYQKIAQDNPAEEKFLNGWLTRARKLPQ